MHNEMPKTVTIIKHMHMPEIRTTSGDNEAGVFSIREHADKGVAHSCAEHVRRAHHLNDSSCTVMNFLVQQAEYRLKRA